MESSLLRWPCHLGAARSASLKSTFCVESKETESRVSGEMSIIILHQVLEIVADSDRDSMLAQKVTFSSGKECGEGAGEVSLGGKLIQWYSSNGGPH